MQKYSLMPTSLDSNTEQKPARILIVSSRGLNSAAASCGCYEFEDLICAVDDADLFSPVNTHNLMRKMYRLAKYIGRSDSLAAKVTPYPKEFTIEHEYDLLLVIVHNIWDLQLINLVQDWQSKCRHKACLITEIHGTELNNWRILQEPFQNFDLVFACTYLCNDRLSKAIDRPVIYLPGGTDALKFCPYPNPPERSIDVIALGRRSPAVHRSLLEQAQTTNFFYYFDTVKKQALEIDISSEHRTKLISLMQRSRFSINYFARFNEPELTRNFQEIGFRFFEGAAAGTIMLGMPPANEMFSQYFDWEDVVIEVDPESQDIITMIAQLDAQPDKLARIRRDNVVNSLLKHDWVYRWQQILAAFNLTPSLAMLDRAQRLEQLAQSIEMSVLKNPV
jgi:Glycosyl transferases group 1